MCEKRPQVNESGPHLDMAEKMFSEIVQMSPTHQNGVVQYITQSVKKSRIDEIEHKLKEVEKLKGLNTEI